MKLKKSQTDTCITLSASEDVSSKELQVLRAGLLNLLNSVDLPIVLDLESVTVKDPSVLPELKKLGETLQAQAGWAPLFVRSPNAQPPLPELRPESSLADAQKKAASPLFRLTAVEPKLQRKLKELEAKKAEAEQKSKSLGNLTQELRNARSENSRLKRLIRGLERQLEAIDRKRTPPLDPIPGAERQAEVEKTVSQILSSQGLLPGGGK